jgi:diadenosine tetraphosphate (Ap4A) HIT family hydrolase
MRFTLDSRLAADTLTVGDLRLCRVLLMNDRRFPWLILVPGRDGLSELHDLAAEERGLLIEEAAFAGEKLKALTSAKKINTAALGNMVAQLHIHVIARFEGDPAWAGPVWGVGKAEPYEPEDAAERLAALRAALGLDGAPGDGAR